MLEEHLRAVERLAERVADRLFADDNILAVAVFGSLAEKTLHSESDLDLYVVERGDALVWKSVYLRERLRGAERARGEGAGTRSILVHLQHLSKAQFAEACSGLGGGPLHRALWSARLVRSRDPEVERLFERMTGFSPADRQLRLLEAAGNLCHALYQASRAGLPASASTVRASRVLESLARVVVVSSGVVPGPDPITQALPLDAEFAAVAEALAEGRRNGEGVRAVVELGRDRLDAGLGEWTAPVVRFLRERGEPASMEEIGEAPPFSKLKGDLEKLILLMARRRLLEESGRPFSLTLSSAARPLFEEIVYAPAACVPTGGAGGVKS